MIDYELTELYESYLAADKYLLHHFSKAFYDYIQGKLNAESGCLIYDQLIKIGQREEISLASVRTWIIEESEVTFQSNQFTQIDQETLISLLSLNQLRIDEVDLLAAVSKWVDCELQRRSLPVNRENRRRVFEPIKGYILFTALTPETFASCKEIAELLTFEERGSLALYLLAKDNPSMVELKTPRKAGSSTCSVFVVDTRYVGQFVYSEAPRLTVNRGVSIRTVFTTYSLRAQHLSLKILDSKGVDLGLKIESVVQDGRLCFSFNPPFVMKPNSEYTFEVIGDGKSTTEDHLSYQRQLSYKGSVVFVLNTSPYENHCIRGLEFYL